MRFAAFIKGWIARTLPELMPQGSLQRCDDLDFSIEGALRSCEELLEITSPTVGITGLTYTGQGFFQVTTGTTVSHTLTYFIRNNRLRRDKDAGGFVDLATLTSAHVLYAPMTPLPSTRQYVYITTPNGLLRDTGEGKYLSGTSWVNVGQAKPTGMSSCLVVEPEGVDGTTIAGWVDGDGGDGASTQATYQARETFQFLGGTAAPANFAQRTKDVGTFGDRIVVEICMYNHTLGTRVAHDYFQLIIETSDVRLNLAFASDGLFANDSVSFNEIGNNLVTTGRWDTWRFDIDFSTAALATVDTTLNGTLQDSDFDCSQTGVYTEGLVTLSQFGDTVLNTQTFMDYLMISNNVGLDGEYRTAYTYYSTATGGESEQSGTSVHTIDSLRKLQVSWPVTGGDRADKVKIYRSIAGGGTLYEVGSVSKSTGSSTSAIADGSLGGPIGDTGKPPSKATLCAAWKSRLWLSGMTWFDSTSVRNRVYFSRAEYPETVPPTYYLTIADSEAEIKALAVMGDALYPITRRRIFTIGGTTKDSFRLENTLSAEGTVATKSVAVGPEGIFFVNYTGVFQFKVKSKKVSEQIDWMFRHSGSSWTSVLTRNEIRDAVGDYWNGEYYLTVGSYTVVYNPSEKRWHRRSTVFTCLWTDEIANRLWTGLSFPSGYTVAKVVTGTSVGQAGLYSPDFVTKAEYISRDPQTKEIKQGRVSQFQVHAMGFWTFYFYVDSVLAHTTTGTTYNLSDRTTLYRLPKALKGTTMYIRGVATGNSVTPDGSRFYSMEVE